MKNAMETRTFFLVKVGKYARNHDRSTIMDKKNYLIIQKNSEKTGEKSDRTNKKTQEHN